LKHEKRPEEIAAILTNQAHTLGTLGELRWAARIFQDRVRELEKAGISGKRLALALDNAGNEVFLLGESALALTMYERARLLFDAGDNEGRIINALNRAQAHMALEDRQAASAAFEEAHDLAFEQARHTIHIEHYRQGFLAAYASALPQTDQAFLLFVEMVRAKDSNQWQEALRFAKLASAKAREAGDIRLALRVEANAAATLADAGQVEPAIKLANQVLSDASEKGLARPEMMALGTLASLSARGADIHQRLGRVSAYARSVVLLEFHKQIVKELKLSPQDLLLEIADPGTACNEIAMEAERYGADALAVRYYQQACSIAREAKASGLLANRLAGLRNALGRMGRGQEETAIADQILALLQEPEVPLLGQLVAHRSLKGHFEKTDLEKAIHHGREACKIFEQLRLRIPAGVARSNVDGQFPRLYQELASMLRRSGDVSGAFEALQFAKGRRLLDALTLRMAGDQPGFVGASTVSEVSSLLNLSDVPTVLVDLAVENDGLTAYVVKDGQLRAAHAAGKVDNLTAAERGDVFERQVRLLNLCRKDPLVLELVTAVASAVGERRPVLIVPDRGLQNLPLHVSPIGAQSWCDRDPISYVPTASVLRFRRKASSAPITALVAGDSRQDLPHAASECEEIASLLGTTALIGTKCTRAAIEGRLRGSEFDVVHLAVHGRSDARRGGRASLLFAAGGATEWTDFAELTQFEWRARLVVLSGCGTGVSGPLQGHQLVGTATAPLEAGASAVLASLWPVGDEACKIFMVAFYRELARRVNNGSVDLRLLLDNARNSLREWLSQKLSVHGKRRDGNRDMIVSSAETSELSSLDPFTSDALQWGPFMLLGDPILSRKGSTDRQRQ
jgi:CHAT domain-containing protein/tetratricopeptide (TPR) repeat protein